MCKQHPNHLNPTNKCSRSNFWLKIKLERASRKNYKKAKKALLAIKLIKKHFSPLDIKALLTTNFYSILYYNSEMWQIPTLKPNLKNLSLSTSANALKLCTPNFTRTTYIIDLHSQNLQSTPNQFMIYKHSLLLFHVYNNHNPSKDWLELNFNQNFNSRETNFRNFSRSYYKIGKN